MSEAAFNEAAEAAEHEDDELEIPEIEEEGEQEVKAVDWEKKFHDAKGQAAKERSGRRAEATARRALEERLEKLEASGKGGADPLETLVAQLREDSEDPINDIEGVKAIIRKFVADRQAEHDQTNTQAANQRQAQQLINTMGEYEADFAADHPDYQDAAKHYRAERQAELEEQGYTGPELQGQLARDLFGIVQRALASGRDPAEATYNLAVKRGFKAGEDSTTDKLAKIAGAAASGVRVGSGKVGGGALTWGAVAAMKGPDRDKAFAKLRDQERRTG